MGQGMANRLALWCLPPSPNRTCAKRGDWRMYGPCGSDLEMSRRNRSTSKLRKLATGVKLCDTLFQNRPRGGGSANNRTNLHTFAKAVRQRHNEIDKSEKLMEDPYGHICDVMSQNVVTMKCDDLVRVKDANNTIVWSMEMDVFEHYTGLPVVDSSGTCVGVLTAADLENRADTCRSDEWILLSEDAAIPEISPVAVAPIRGLPVSAVMSSPAIVIKEHAPIAYAAALMLQNKVHRLPVADANGLLVGIVTRTDIFEPVSEVNPVYHVVAGRHRDSPEFTDE